MLLSTSPDDPGITFSTPPGEKRHYSLWWVSQRDCSFYLFWVILPSIAIVLYICMSGSVLRWILKGTLSRPLNFCVHLSPVWCSVPWILNHLACLDFWLQPLILKETAELWPGFLSLHHNLETVSRQWVWANYRTHVACVASLIDHCFSLSNVQYLDNHYFLYFVLLFTYFRQEGKSIHYYSIMGRNKGPKSS